MTQFAVAALGAALLLGAPARAERVVNICIPVNPFPPLTFADHEGQGQYLARKAIERQGAAVQYQAVPWLRCTEGVTNGTYDAAMPPSAMFATTLALPMRAGQVDTQQAVGEVTIGVLRRVGSAVDWDGNRFTGLNHPVMFNRGIVSIKEKLAKLGVQGDEGSHYNESLLRKLVAGRGDIVIMNLQAAQAELAEDEYRGKLEVLPAPFLSFTLYLAFNPRYYSANTAFAHAVWSDIARQRTAPEWAKLAPTMAK